MPPNRVKLSKFSRERPQTPYERVAPPPSRVVVLRNLQYFRYYAYAPERHGTF